MPCSGLGTRVVPLPARPPVMHTRQSWQSHEQSTTTVPNAQWWFGQRPCLTSAFRSKCKVQLHALTHVCPCRLETCGCAHGCLNGALTRAARAQDKLLQKEHFAAAGVPVADFRGVASAADAHAAAADFGFPLMLKSRRCFPYAS